MSEPDEEIEQPTPPEPVEADEPTVEPPAAPVLAEPGMYWCEEEYPGIHPVLQSMIQKGENDFTGVTSTEHLAAIAALVRDGVLMGPM